MLKTVFKVFIAQHWPWWLGFYLASCAVLLILSEPFGLSELEGYSALMNYYFGVGIAIGTVLYILPSSHTLQASLNARPLGLATAFLALQLCALLIVLWLPSVTILAFDMLTLGNVQLVDFLAISYLHLFAVAGLLCAVIVGQNRQWYLLLFAIGAFILLLSTQQLTLFNWPILITLFSLWLITVLGKPVWRQWMMAAVISLGILFTALLGSAPFLASKLENDSFVYRNVQSMAAIELFSWNQYQADPFSNTVRLNARHTFVNDRPLSRRNIRESWQQHNTEQAWPIEQLWQEKHSGEALRIQSTANSTIVAFTSAVYLQPRYVRMLQPVWQSADADNSLSWHAYSNDTALFGGTSQVIVVNLNQPDKIAVVDINAPQTPFYVDFNHQDKLTLLFTDGTRQVYEANSNSLLQETQIDFADAVNTGVNSLIANTSWLCAVLLQQAMSETVLLAMNPLLALLVALSCGLITALLYRHHAQWRWLSLGVLIAGIPGLVCALVMVNPSRPTNGKH